MRAERPSCRPLVAPFALHLVAHDIPALDRAQRDHVVERIVRRIDRMPSLSFAGVIVISGVLRAALLLGWSFTRRFAGLPIPLLSEYPRLVRSLALAETWERWPATSASAAP